MNPLLYLYQSAMTVSGTRWHLLSSDVFLINAVFCRHNIVGINGPKLSFTEDWWRLLISGVVYKFAGYKYWSAMSSTNPRCSLQIRGKKFKCSKQTQKRSQAKIISLLLNLMYIICI